MNVSVIITYYNKDELLLSAIESIYLQIGDKDEVVVVNDCSTSELSKSSLQKAKNKYKKCVLFLDTPKNSGASFAKHYGIKNSKNNIIILLDADDILPVETIKKIKEKFKSDETIALVYGNYLRNDVNENIEGVINCDKVSEEGILNPSKLARNWILLGTSPFKKDVYFEVGGFDRLYPKTDDVDFQRRLIVSDYKCAYIDDIVYVWNRYPNGNNSGHKRTETLFSIMRNFEFYFKYLNGLDFLMFMIKELMISIYLKFKRWNEVDFEK